PMTLHPTLSHLAGEITTVHRASQGKSHDLFRKSFTSDGWGPGRRLTPPDGPPGRSGANLPYRFRRRTSVVSVVWVAPWAPGCSGWVDNVIRIVRIVSGRAAGRPSPSR